MKDQFLSEVRLLSSNSDQSDDLTMQSHPIKANTWRNSLGKLACLFPLLSFRLWFIMKAGSCAQIFSYSNIFPELLEKKKSIQHSQEDPNLDDGFALASGVTLST